MHDSIDRSDVRPQGRAGRLVRVAMVFALAVALAACSSPGGEGTPEPEPGPTTIADYVVPGAEVAQVTRVSGRIEGYLAPALAPAAVTTSFVGLGAVTSCVGDGDTVECTYSPGRPWIPAPIEADGSFAIDLPASPDLGEDLFTFELCGAPLEVAMNGVIVAHDGALGDVGVEPLAQYARAWFTEDSVIPPNALFPDPSVVVVYGYAPSPRVARCVDTVESGDPEQPGTSIDVDVDVRPGWNVMTWVTRSESGELTVYLRSGEPNAEVPWVMIEESAP